MRNVVALFVLLVFASLTTEQTLKAGFLYITNPGDEGYTYQHDFGRQMTEALYSGILKTNYTPDLLPEDVTAPPVIQRYLNENYDIIIGTSVGFGQLLLEAAQAHPEKKFASVFAVLVSNQSNLAMLNPYLHQAFFLTGVVAGGTSEGPFCYLGSMEIPEVFQMINAYALGVRVFRPNATIELVYSGTWADPPLEDEIARYMLARGCKIFTAYTDTSAGQEVFVKAGLPALGSGSDMGRHIGSELLLASAAFGWARGFSAVVEAALNRTQPAAPDGSWFVAEGLDTGLVEFTPPTSLVPDPVRARALAMAEMIRSNKREVFTGPIFDSNGNERIPAGSSVSDENVWVIGWLINNLTDLGLYSSVGCAAGNYTDAMTSRCKVCPAGTYQPTEGAVVFACPPCPAGKYTNAAGQASCLPCAAGTAKSTASTELCSPCPAGWFSPANATSCTPCPPGSFSQAEGSPSCSPCAIGQYSKNDGSTSCLACPAHATTLDVGAADKSACMCDAGFQQNSEAGTGVPALDCVVVPAVTQPLSSNAAGIAVAVVVSVFNAALVAGFLVWFFIRFVKQKDKKESKE